MALPNFNRRGLLQNMPRSLRNRRKHFDFSPRKNADWFNPSARRSEPRRTATAKQAVQPPSWQWHRTGSRWFPVRTLPVAPLWCDLGFFPNSRGNNAAANLRPTSTNGVAICIRNLRVRLNRAFYCRRRCLQRRAELKPRGPARVKSRTMTGEP